ncbi:hypothetical protein [Jeotgalibacillus haloalkalitolerans]|uniref:Uncharacterized protein n=1 Tax=Jeotgalibacillus haloalkalitolerans TaxID=3104292 RepID=A0ABU5KLN8_9BACL|nr:hypothetical protein [Jeotgalibacillus sp. HH7-29]MDZ5711630.1 hypothetical protein [Jeotgalibacillus sp. HH7-29]
MRDAWVLKLKEESKEDGMEGVFYFCDEDGGENDFLTQDLNEATIFPDKYKEIESMKEYEKGMLSMFGTDAVLNAGYTHMMKNFEFVEVEIEEVESK